MSRHRTDRWTDVRDDSAREALACLMAEPARGFADAYAAGCRVGLFAQPHHVALWMCAAALAHHGKLTGDVRADRRAVLGLTLRMLERAGAATAARDDELLTLSRSWFDYVPRWTAEAVGRLAEAAELVAVERRAAELRARLTGRRAA